jgi:transcriptional regulator with XRE-family HTH domain
MLDVTTDREIAKELGRRLRAYRLAQNLGAAEVAARAGLNRNTIVNAETGANPRLDTIIKILRVFGRLDAFDAFLPAPTLSPLEVMRSAKKPRQRARRTSRG